MGTGCCSIPSSNCCASLHPHTPLLQPPVNGEGQAQTPRCLGGGQTPRDATGGSAGGARASLSRLGGPSPGASLAVSRPAGRGCRLLR